MEKEGPASAMGGGESGGQRIRRLVEGGDRGPGFQIRELPSSSVTRLTNQKFSPILSLQISFRSDQRRRRVGAPSKAHQFCEAAGEFSPLYEVLGSNPVDLYDGLGGDSAQVRSIL